MAYDFRQKSNFFIFAIKHTFFSKLLKSSAYLKLYCYLRDGVKYAFNSKYKCFWFVTRSLNLSDVTPLYCIIKCTCINVLRSVRELYFLSFTQDYDDYSSLARIKFKAVLLTNSFVWLTNTHALFTCDIALFTICYTNKYILQN